MNQQEQKEESVEPPRNNTVDILQYVREESNVITVRKQCPMIIKYYIIGEEIIAQVFVTLNGERQFVKQCVVFEHINELKQLVKREEIAAVGIGYEHHITAEVGNLIQQLQCGLIIENCCANLRENNVSN